MAPQTSSLSRRSRLLLSLNLCLILLFSSIYLHHLGSVSEAPGDRFVYQGHIHWAKAPLVKGSLTFQGGGRALTLLVSPVRTVFLLNGRPIGQSAVGEPWTQSPLPFRIAREGARWSARVGPDFSAAAICPLPPTESVVVSFEPDISLEADCQPFRPKREPIELILSPWDKRESEKEGLFWTPKKSLAVPSVEWLTIPHSLSFGMEAELRIGAGKRVGIGIVTDEATVYLASLFREPRSDSPVMIQLVKAQREESGWNQEVVAEQVTGSSVMSWVRLQVFCSEDRLWLCRDDEMIAEQKIGKPVANRIGLWWEGADKPYPSVRQLRWRDWRLLAWRQEPDGATEPLDPPIPLSGSWRKQKEGYSLVAARHPAIALVEHCSSQGWFISDVLWTGQPFGLVWGFRAPSDYHLVRLTSLGKATELQLVVVKGRKERVLDKVPLWLEGNKTYRLAVHLSPEGVRVYLNGLELLFSPEATEGFLGLWSAKASLFKNFIFHPYNRSLIPLIPEHSGVVMPDGEGIAVVQEAVSLTLPLGFPPGVPMMARLSQSPVTVFVERREDTLHFTLWHQDQVWGEGRARLPDELPATVHLERRGSVILVRLGEKIILTRRSTLSPAAGLH
ncbi:MAG: hypothetical protein NZ959_03015 [Armatimonadetes bacterium]|nr:hypothetical protein [Armatimonadota bacterium]MDW8121578.1 hypothetical protein [Armatimonadota bacterium]